MVKVMKKAFKPICLALAGLMAATAFTGCSKSTSSSAGSSSSTSSTATSSASKPADEKATISLSMWSAVPDAPNNFIDTFEAKYPNIKVNVNSITEGDYSQKINTMVASGTAPEVMLLWECDIPKMAKAGKIDKLDDYIANSQDVKADDFIPAVGKLNTQNGACYGLPWCVATEICYYNKDMFDAANLAYPKDDWTQSEMLADAQKLTVSKNGTTSQWGMASPNFVGIWYANIGATGDNILDANNQLTLGSGATKSLQFMSDLVNKYKVMPAPSADTTTDLFAAGKAAIFETGSWMISSYKDAAFHWDIVPLPKDQRQYASLHTGFYAINAKSKHKDADWTFINYMMSSDGQKVVEAGSANPSAKLSMQDDTSWQVKGKNGPTNWQAVTDSLKFSVFGYVLSNPGATSNAQKYFQQVAAGTLSAQDAVNKSNEDAKTMS